MLNDIKRTTNQVRKTMQNSSAKYIASPTCRTKERLWRWWIRLRQCSYYLYKTLPRQEWRYTKRKFI